MQSNFNEGIVTKNASGAITSNHVLKLTTAGKVTECTAVGDVALFVALHDAADGKDVACVPLSPGRSIRIKSSTISGTQNAGVAYYLSVDDGLIDVTSTNATKIGYSEETATTGQLVLIRPISPA